MPVSMNNLLDFSLIAGVSSKARALCGEQAEEALSQYEAMMGLRPSSAWEAEAQRPAVGEQFFVQEHWNLPPVRDSRRDPFAQHEVIFSLPAIPLNYDRAGVHLYVHDDNERIATIRTPIYEAPNVMQPIAHDDHYGYRVQMYGDDTFIRSYLSGRNRIFGILIHEDGAVAGLEQDTVREIMVNRIAGNLITVSVQRGVNARYGDLQAIPSRGRFGRPVWRAYGCMNELGTFLVGEM